MHDLLDGLLALSVLLEDCPHEFLENGLSIDAVDQQVIELLSDLFELGWTLLSEDELCDLSYFLLVGGHHAFAVFGELGGLELNDGES